MNKKHITFIFMVVLSAVFSGALLWVFRDATKQEVVTVENEPALAAAISSQPTAESSRQDEKIAEPHPDSIDAMRLKTFGGDDLKLGNILDDNEAYTRYYITYTSEGFNISGVMNVPKGKGSFPIVIANHGFIEPEVYKNGQGLKREQDYLAREGFVVVHSDYRNYGDSDFDPNNEVRPRSGYVEDIMNLISALEKSDYDFLDTKNMGMLGHSMGGGVTLNVMAIAPPQIKAYVLMAPINADYQKNFDRWVTDTWPDVARQVMDTYGTFEDNPEFWKSVSAINYMENVNAPVQLHQGTADTEVPVQWSRDLAQVLKDHNKDINYYEYPGIDHLFLNNIQTVMNHAVELFDKQLK